MLRLAKIVLRAVLAGVFLYAAWTKFREPWTIFAVAIDSYGLLPEWAVLTLARTLPWIELALGLVLLTGLWLRHTSLAAAALLGVFLSAMLVAYARGLSIDCGCFGPGDTLGTKTLLRDSSLVAMAAALAFLCRRGGRPSDRAGL
ncbi:MAG: DoxX family membrane protein [Acidobacteriia bacterium]|nr:DoxX family membrane protein [Terriglobia bacterium]